MIEIINFVGLYIFQVEKIIYPNTTILFDESFKNIHNYVADSDLNNRFYFVDSEVYNIYKDIFNSLKNIIIINSSEESKSLLFISSLIDKILNLGANKHSYIIAVGGGVICDIAGFVASIFMRGVRFAFVPTTILAITDASLGGKNGVNFGSIKNLVGTINEPNFILIDFSFIKSLKKNEYDNGFAEIIKHACIASPELFLCLEKLIINYKSKKFFYNILKDSISIKLDIVLKDLKDLSCRRVLNFGHTYGHAIEAKYKFPHGRSVSLGIVFASLISNKLGYLSYDNINRIKKLLIKFDLPVDISEIQVKELLPFIFKDKKAKQNNIDFIVLKDIGVPEILNIEIDKIIYA